MADAARQRGQHLKVLGFALLAATAAGVTSQGRLVDEALAAQTAEAAAAAGAARRGPREGGPESSSVSVSSRGRLQGLPPASQLQGRVSASALDERRAGSGELQGGAVKEEVDATGLYTRDVRRGADSQLQRASARAAGARATALGARPARGVEGIVTCHGHWWCINEWNVFSGWRQGDRGESTDNDKTWVGNDTIETVDYDIVWADEFDSDGPVNASNWATIELNGGFGNNEEQMYTKRPENSYVKNGSLFIVAKAEEVGGANYTSAKIASRQGWRYGKMAVRARLKDATANGTWGAAWMLPAQDTYGFWPGSGEIDIMQFVGAKSDRIYGSVHTAELNHLNGTQLGGHMKTNISDWHTYTTEWKPDKISFACDDDVFQVFERENGNTTDSKKWPFDQPFYIILNLAVGGSWGGLGGIDHEAFKKGQSMEVDFVRVYQKSESA